MSRVATYFEWWMSFGVVTENPMAAIISDNQNSSLMILKRNMVHVTYDFIWQFSRLSNYQTTWKIEHHVNVVKLLKFLIKTKSNLYEGNCTLRSTWSSNLTNIPKRCKKLENEYTLLNNNIHSTYLLNVVFRKWNRLMDFIKGQIWMKKKLTQFKNKCPTTIVVAVILLLGHPAFDWTSILAT